jgi:transposase InsO family protein
VTVASFVAAQRTDYGVPHAVACRALEISESWFYKWHERRPTARAQRRADLDAAVRWFFDRSGGVYGSPRIHDDLVEAGWQVSVNSVAASMVRQGLVARPPKRKSRNLTRPDKKARPFPDRLNRDFSAAGPNQKWCGDMTEIPTAEGKLYLSTAIDLFSRRLLGYATSDHPDAPLAMATIRMAVAVRGGDVRGAIFHTDRGSTYTAKNFTALCRSVGVVQSMGRVGSCFDNAAAESFFSTLEHEVLSRHRFATKQEARKTVVPWIVNFYNSRRRHSACGSQSPIDYETAWANREVAA